MSPADGNYDVVIVGAGIAGAMVAKVLADHGKSVLVLEAGTAEGLDFEGYRGYVQRYYTETFKVPNSPYPRNLDAPEANVLDITNTPYGETTNPTQMSEGYLVQLGPMPFSSDWTRAAGGTTLHWLGTCLRMLPHDFRLKTHYGHGVDWPIEYQDLRPWYELAEREIGVAAEVSEQVYPGMGDDYFGRDYVYPMLKIPQSYLDQVLARGVQGMSVQMGDERIALSVGSTPQGRNSIPNPNYLDPATGVRGFQPVGAVGEPYVGQRCEGNSSCVPICPVQAKYNALKTLHQALRSRKGRVELSPQSVASRVLLDENGRVSGIEYKHYADPKSPQHDARVARGTLYVIAAHAVESAKLLLASRTEALPNGIANSSMQLGKNLMDHPCLLTWGLLPENVGAFRGPGSTSGISSFRDGAFRRQHASFRVEIGNWGWNWPAFSPGSDVERAVDRDNLFGKSLRQHLAAKLPRQFRIAWEAEQIPEESNCVTIDDRYRDRLGNYRPVIHYDLPAYTRAGLAQGKRVWDLLCRRLAIDDHTAPASPGDPSYFEIRGQGYTWKGAGHVVGTHRMGGDRKNSVVDDEQRTWDHDNLYVVGCGSMSTLGTSNPTLTMAALALRSAAAIAKAC